MWMVEDILDGLLEELGVADRIARVAWLEAEDLRLGLKVQVGLDILPLIDDLELVDALDVERRILGGTSDPMDRTLGERMGAVGLDVDDETSTTELVEER